MKKNISKFYTFGHPNNSINLHALSRMLFKSPVFEGHLTGINSLNPLRGILPMVLACKSVKVYSYNISTFNYRYSYLAKAAADDGI